MYPSVHKFFGVTTSLKGQDFTFLKSVCLRCDWLVTKVDLEGPMLGPTPFRRGKTGWVRWNYFRLARRAFNFFLLFPIALALAISTIFDKSLPTTTRPIIPMPL